MKTYYVALFAISACGTFAVLNHGPGLSKGQLIPGKEGQLRCSNQQPSSRLLEQDCRQEASTTEISAGQICWMLREDPDELSPFCGDEESSVLEEEVVQDRKAKLKASQNDLKDRSRRRRKGEDVPYADRGQQGSEKRQAIQKPAKAARLRLREDHSQKTKTADALLHLASSAGPAGPAGPAAAQ